MILYFYFRVFEFEFNYKAQYKFVNRKLENISQVRISVNGQQKRF